LTSIAFPAISTGVYGYPAQEACAVAVETASTFDPGPLRTILFVCFDAQTTALYQSALAS
jgi:O-acetyl-ADP-ribose deacetylase (regulator of RNase III)